MELLVIGGTGTIGSLLVEELRTRGHAVRVAGRSTGFDLTRPSTWAATFEGVRRCFYLSPRTVPQHAEVGAAVFAALRQARVQRVVNLTGFGVDRAVGTPLFELERELERSGLEYTHVRPNYVMQNLCAGPAWRELVERDELSSVAAEAAISWVDARDIAAVCTAALERDDLVGPGLDLTGPVGVTQAQFASALSNALGRTVRSVSLDDAAGRARLLSQGVPPERIEARLGFLALARTGALAPVSPHVEAVLGRPAISVETFARDYAARWTREVA
ncbi:MAG: NAD(P)H-binding protein [Archangium sp.]|nr:NAD(P)H-binding protein [Archangium sp.]